MSANECLGKPSQETICETDFMHCIGQSYEIDRAVALSPLASADVLEKLAQSNDKEIRRNIVCNIATPAHTLMLLAQEFPSEFFVHPLLDLMILEDPQLLTRLKPGVLKSFLSDPGCPESFVSWACLHGYKTDQLEILKRSDLSALQLRQIARGPHPKAAERATNRLIEMGELW